MPRFREALLKGAPEAMAAWRNLGRTARWLRANATLFRQPMLPVVTVLVDASDSSLEIASLCYRHNVSPALVAATDPPSPDPARRQVLVAAGIVTPAGAVRGDNSGACRSRCNRSCRCAGRYSLVATRPA